MNQSNKITKAKKFSYLATLIALCSLPLSFSGCTSYFEVEPNQETSLTVDLTKSKALFAKYSSERIYEYVIKHLDITKNRFTSKGIIFRVSVIGESARPETVTLTLNPSKSLFLTKKNPRIAEINKFKKDIKLAIENITKDSSNQMQSHIGSSICYQLRTLAESDFSENKSLLILSDGLESTFQMEFIDYANSIEDFERKYPEFSDILNQSCSLPKDISNIKITMCNSPVIGLNEIVLASERFWSFHLGKSKGMIKFTPNL